MGKTNAKTSHYFVDEAGDLSLFDKKGSVIIGKEGVSKCFIVGVALVKDISTAKEKLENLRKELLSDPYFCSVPSMQPERKKTALVFHAKDDLPEVRREVFKILQQLDVKVQIAIRRKKDIADSAQIIYKTTGSKINENDIYDDLVKRLFKNLLHKYDNNYIHFARRGKSDRTLALQKAIAKAKNNFELSHDKPSDKPVEIIPAYPHEYIGLQIIDYHLWTIQRLIERCEDRFYNLLA